MKPVLKSGMPGLAAVLTAPGGLAAGADVGILSGPI
jgi:hypothetical protein